MDQLTESLRSIETDRCAKICETIAAERRVAHEARIDQNRGYEVFAAEILEGAARKMRNG